MLLRRTTKLLKMAIASVFLAALALMCVPLCINTETGRVNDWSFLVAAVFWLSLILEQVFFWIANAGRRKIQHKAFHGQLLARGTVGIITFGSSKEAKIADIVLGASFVISILLILFKVQSYWLVACDLAVLLLSLNLHCILNGKTYRYIKAIHIIKKEPKRNGRTEN